MAGFVNVGKVSDFRDGIIRTFDIEDREVGVVTWKGQFYAFSGTCTHEYSSFAWSRICPGDSFDVIMCSSHYAVFKLGTGEVLEGPAEENLPWYSVRIEGDDVLVSLDGAPTPSEAPQS